MTKQDFSLACVASLLFVISSFWLLPTTVIATENAADKKNAQLERSQKTVPARSAGEKTEPKMTNFVREKTVIATEEGNRCEVARAKIMQQMKYFDVFKSDRSSDITKFAAKLDRVIEKLQDEQIDVTQLKSNSERLKSLSLDLDTALELYLQKVEAAQQLSTECDSASTEFLSALKETRTQMQVVRTKAQAVRSFVATTLQADLRTARQVTLKNKKTSPGTTTGRTTVVPTTTPVPVQ